VLAASELVKRAVPSFGDEESVELRLVAVRDGVNLRSRAKGFRRGTLLAWFGGIRLDLREAELAPGARLSVHALFGGIAVIVPTHWRVDSTATGLNGRVEVHTAGGDFPEAPALAVDGMAVFGGIAIVGKEETRADRVPMRRALKVRR
jgi:hypothetical protein